MRVLVAGAGAIGGITGAFMASNGYDVTLYDIDREHVKKIKEKGLVIEGIRGKKVVKVKAVSRIRGEYDVVMIAVKSQYTEDVMKKIMPHLSKRGIVVSLQNSINEEKIAEFVGVKRTIGCVIGWSATNVAPGKLEFTSEGNFIIGRLDGKITKDVEKVKEMLESVAPVEITDNILGYLWIKLAINSVIAPMGVITGKLLGDIVKERKTIPLMAALADEFYRVISSLRIKPASLEGIDYNFMGIDDIDDFKRVASIIMIAASKHEKLKSTMLQDVEKGRRTEIDYFNGYIEKKAEEVGIPTPVNQAVIKIVKEIESGKRKPGMKNINEIYKQVRVPKSWFEVEIDEDGILNLPCKIKFENATKTSGIFLMGATAAFSKAFSRITNSIIGKLFVRKSEWEISDIVLSRFLFEMGKNIGEMVKSAYSFDKSKNSLKKTVYIVLKNMGMNCSIEENGVAVLGKCIFEEGAESVGIKDKIVFPVCVHLLRGISHNFDADIAVRDARCLGNERCFLEIK